jgi:hypothetical protein
MHGEAPASRAFGRRGDVVGRKMLGECWEEWPPDETSRVPFGRDGSRLRRSPTGAAALVALVVRYARGTRREALTMLALYVVAAHGYGLSGDR